MQQYGRKPPTSLADLPAPRMRSGVHPSPPDLHRRLDSDRAEADGQDFEQVSDADVERLDGQIEALVEQLRAAEERAAYAEQYAIQAGQQAAYAEQQLAVQAASPAPERLVYAEPDAPPRGSGFATWLGWCLFVIVAGLAAAAYFTMYEPLRAQLAAQTKLNELQTSQRREAEAALRASFDRERDTLNEQLSAARAAASAATPAAAVADAPAAPEAAKHPAHVDRAAAAKAAKLEARAAKREAMLAKKAERAAKRDEHAAKHKEHSATASAAKSGAADKPAPAEPKHKAAAPADEGGGGASNDPLDGL